MKIYQYMKSLGLQKVYFTQLFLRLAAMMLGIWIFWLLQRYDLIAITILFCVFSFFSHFCIYYDWYSRNLNSNLAQVSKIRFLTNQMCSHITSNGLIQCYLYGALLYNFAWFCPTYSASCFLMIAFFLLYTVNNSDFSKKEWFLLNHLTGVNIMLSMKDDNSYYCAILRACKRSFLGLLALAICLYCNAPELGFAFMRFSSYSIIYHFSKYRYQYQNISNPHSLIEKILLQVRWITAFGSVCILFVLPHLWAIPFITIHILEAVEQQFSGFSPLPQDMEVVSS